MSSDLLTSGYSFHVAPSDLFLPDTHPHTQKEERANEEMGGGTKSLRETHSRGQFKKVGRRESLAWFGLSAFFFSFLIGFHLFFWRFFILPHSFFFILLHLEPFDDEHVKKKPPYDRQQHCAVPHAMKTVVIIITRKWSIAVY